MKQESRAFLVLVNAQTDRSSASLYEGLPLISMKF